MCDTMIVLPTMTESGKTIFAKNSDREPNEAQAVVHYSRQIHSSTELQCTYKTIPQVKETYSVILSKPFWAWGAEMGVNEFGVTIGNAVVFTKMPIDKESKSLTGNDLVRLGLERGKTAKRALEIMIELLVENGSDGCMGYENKNFFSHHSFIIADPYEAWVLESAGNEWAAEKVKDCRTISNGLTIGEKYDLISATAIDTAHKNGWIKSSNFNFSEAYALEEMNLITACKVRQEVTQLGINRRRRFQLTDAFNVLSSHSFGELNVDEAGAKNVCMHANKSNQMQTVNSMVVQLDGKSKIEVWVTASSNPCLSFFKPISFDNTDLNCIGIPGSIYDTSFWWIVERFHRLAINDYTVVARYIRENILPAYEAKIDYNGKIDPNVTREAFEFHRTAAIEGFKNLEGKIRAHSFFSSYGRYWKKENKKVSI